MSQRETARAATHLEADALTIRALTREADEAAVLRLFLAAPAYTLAVEGRMPCQDDVDDFFEGMPPGKRAADKFMLGFELGAETIGCADLIRAHPEPDCAFLGLLLFDQARQGRGHGRAALGLIETLARGWGATRLRLAAVSRHPRAVAFWQREGFALCSRVSQPRFTGELLVMERAIG
ncbi:GNAT family N-acetyltransferase [Burkholderia gladioli]|uniref:GNAT family N-acetyltransferase n=1 Tax=Burkholderia gladioli TaxID=28095 RepID=UPI00163E138C|nr:GNAT family N-acetyltransferase [Burkholderia gladioli]